MPTRVGVECGWNLEFAERGVACLSVHWRWESESNTVARDVGARRPWHFAGNMIVRSGEVGHASECSVIDLVRNTQSVLSEDSSSVIVAI